MHAEVVQKLLEINRQFYTNFGGQFSLTRQRIQPGVRKILAHLAEGEYILDLGCGNGELARVLTQNNFRGTYMGLDFSLPLLDVAQNQDAQSNIQFSNVDLTASDWDEQLGQTHYSVITAFAVLHHIPGGQLRREIIEKVCSLLASGGEFILSNWQFLNSEKLSSRIQPWEAIGLSDQDLDDGDYLLDWRSGGTGLRYVHHFSQQELEELAAETGFRVKESFFSDGEGGRLGLYHVWERYEK